MVNLTRNESQKRHILALCPSSVQKRTEKSIARVSAADANDEEEEQEEAKEEEGKQQNCGGGGGGGRRKTIESRRRRDNNRIAFSGGGSGSGIQQNCGGSDGGGVGILGKCNLSSSLASTGDTFSQFFSVQTILCAC